MNTLYQQLAGESVGAALQRLESEIKSRPGRCRFTRGVRPVSMSEPVTGRARWRS